MRSRPSLRHLLPVLFFLLAAIPAGSIGILLTNRAWDREVQTIHDQHLQLAQHVASALDRYAEDVQAVFHLASANLSTNQPVSNLTTLLNRLHFKHVCVVDSTGKVERFISTTPDFRLERVSKTLLTQLRAGDDTEEEHPPPMSQVSPDSRNNPTIFLWHPLDKNRYALGALKTTYFHDLQSSIVFGKKGHAAIVDRDGRVIAHPKPQWQVKMQDLSELDPVSRMMAGETGVSWFFSPAVKAAMVAGFTTVPKTGWGVMVPQPLSELDAQVTQVKLAVWTVVGLALLCATVLGWLASQWLAAPLQRIGMVAARFAKGDYETRVGKLGWFPTQEAANLAAQINIMADEVTTSSQARRQSEDRFREFAQIAADWFWETDMNQVFTYMSPISTSGRRLDSEAFIGQPRREFIMDETADEIIERIQAAMDREEPFENIQFMAIGSERGPTYVTVSGKPIRHLDDTIIGYRGVTHDITEQLFAEAQLRQARQEEEVRQAQKMEAIGTLAGGIAHDFNNTLGIILGYTDLTLQTAAPDSIVRKNLQHVLTAGQRAKDVIQQILTFSRSSEPERQPVSLRQLTQDALQLIRASLPTTISIQSNLSDNGPDTVLADVTQLHQVLMNLASNAEYAMRESGGIFSVSIDTAEVDQGLLLRYPELKPAPYVRLVVQDSGHGIETATAERIFEPFFTTKRVGEGTGMGLAVVHGIIASHGGVITIRSTQGVGTTFTIYLPLIATIISPTPPSDNITPYGTGTVLFVDDDEVLSLLGEQMLNYLGYDVVIETHSPNALATFQANPHRFDLVITDQTMPTLTGAALAQELRQIRPDIPIILCTGFSHSIDADQAEAQHIDAFCMKPLVAHDLGLAIRNVLTNRII